MKQTYQSVAQFLQTYKTAERFSNFTQNDLSFTQNDLSQFAAPNQTMSVSKPYVVQFANTTNTTLNAVLFGFNKYFASGSQFGSDVGIVVTALPTTTTTYSQLLAQSSTNPFDVGKWRFVVTSGSNSELDQTITFTFINANGRLCTDPLTMGDYKNEFQQDNTRITIHYPLKVDGNTYVTIPLIGACTLTVSIYPATIADLARPVIGNNPVQGYVLPQLNGVPFINSMPQIQPQALPIGVSPNVGSQLNNLRG